MTSQRDRDSAGPPAKEDWYPRLLEAITTAQSQLLGEIRRGTLFDGLLSALLGLTESEYGFIGEVKWTETSVPFLKTHAITNIAWNEETTRFYEENAPSGMEFTNLESLFGTVMTSEAPVISNRPSVDPRRGGLPEGHPPLNAFLGVPLRSGGSVVGMVGVANRPGGYEEALVHRLEPFLQTCANAIFAVRAEQARQRAEERLRDEEAKARGVLEGVVEAVITIDEGGLIQSFNPAAERMFGYLGADIRGKNVNSLMPEPMHSEHGGYIQAYLKTGKANVIGLGREVEGLRRDGRTIPIDLSISEVLVGGHRLFTGILRDLTERREAEKKLESLREEIQRTRFGQMIGRSPVMQRLYEVIEEVALGDWTVLIEGETGSGKELVARAIQAASHRKDEHFVAVNCAGLADPLLGSQLFGHRRGAFTGAVRDQEGLFQAADRGTLFLDEIGDISPNLQTSLLRVLQEGEIVRIGDTAPRKVDVRVVAATNRNLEAEVREGRFRKDLFYRLRVARVTVPPLRERGQDVLMLAEAVLAEARVATGKAITGLSQDAERRLLSYDWPGNVRELWSAVQHGAIHCKDHTIQVLELPPEFQDVDTRATEKKERRSSSDERERVLDALRRVGGNRSKAARLLGISRATLYRRIDTLDI